MLAVMATAGNLLGEGLDAGGSCLSPGGGDLHTGEPRARRPGKGRPRPLLPPCCWPCRGPGRPPGRREAGLAGLPWPDPAGLFPGKATGGDGGCARPWPSSGAPGSRGAARDPPARPLGAPPPAAERREGKGVAKGPSQPPLPPPPPAPSPPPPGLRCAWQAATRADAGERRGKSAAGGAARAASDGSPRDPQPERPGGRPQDRAGERLSGARPPAQSQAPTSAARAAAGLVALGELEEEVEVELGGLLLQAAHRDPQAALRRAGGQAGKHLSPSAAALRCPRPSRRLSVPPLPPARPDALRQRHPPGSRKGPPASRNPRPPPPPPAWRGFLIFDGARPPPRPAPGTAAPAAPPAAGSPQGQRRALRPERGLPPPAHPLVELPCPAGGCCPAGRAAAWSRVGGKEGGFHVQARGEEGRGGGAGRPQTPKQARPRTHGQPSGSSPDTPPCSRPEKALQEGKGGQTAGEGAGKASQGPKLLGGGGCQLRGETAWRFQRGSLRRGGGSGERRAPSARMPERLPAFQGGLKSRRSRRYWWLNWLLSPFQTGPGFPPQHWGRKGFSRAPGSIFGTGGSLQGHLTGILCGWPPKLRAVP